MSRNSDQRRGLVFGAIVALLSTFFVSTPAQAAATDGGNIALRPEAGTSYVGVVYNEFDMYAQLLPGESNSNFDTDILMYKVEVTSGFDMDVVLQSSGSAVTDTVAATSGSADVVVIAASDAATSASFNASVSSGVSYLSVKAHSTSNEATSWSAVTLRITAWIDEVTVGDGLTTGDGVRDADEWYTTKTVTLHNASSIPFTANWTAPDAADTWLTASATITGVNFQNIGSGKFFLAVSSSEAILGGANQESSSPKSGALLNTHGGVITSSWQLDSGITESTTASFALRYDKAGTGGTYTAGFLVGSVTDYQATAPGITAISVSAVAAANISGSGTAYTVRPNETVTVRIHTLTNSTSVSAVTTVTVGGTALVTSSKLLSIDGGAFLTTYPAAGVSKTTGTDGYATMTLATSGFVENDTITLDVAVGNVSSTQVTLTVKNPTYLVEPAYELYTTTPGTAVSIPVTVNDQWGEASSRTDHYLKVTRGGTGFNYGTTISYQAVTGGAATVNFTPEAATATGSATVQIDVVKLVNGAYISDGLGEDVTVNVSTTTDAFTTGLSASFSASVSYFPSTVSWVTVTGKVANTGSAVVVSGDGLIFRASSALPATASGTLTVRADTSQGYSFDVASLRAGSFTMNLSNGASATSSLLVVDPVDYDAGSQITFDTTTIDAGKTKIVTGTVTDVNGNPVDTTRGTGSATLVISYAGNAGIPVGTLPTETDADGNFKISILTAASDQGTMTITATYMKAGASTAAADKVTKAQTITIGTASAASSDQKVNAGSFKGYVAVYAKGYEGQRLSAKVGNDWVVVPSLASNFERVVEFTGAGYTIAVRIYIDRVLVDTITVTTK